MRLQFCSTDVKCICSVKRRQSKIFEQEISKQACIPVQAVTLCEAAQSLGTNKMLAGGFKHIGLGNRNVFLVNLLFKCFLWICYLKSSLMYGRDVFYTKRPMVQKRVPCEVVASPQAGQSLMPTRHIYPAGFKILPHTTMPHQQRHKVKPQNPSIHQDNKDTPKDVPTRPDQHVMLF